MKNFLISFLMLINITSLGMKDSDVEEFSIDAPVKIKLLDDKIVTLEGVKMENDNYNYDYLNQLIPVKNLVQSVDIKSENSQEVGYYDMTQIPFPITEQTLNYLVDVVKKFCHKKIDDLQNEPIIFEFIKEKSNNKSFSEILDILNACNYMGLSNTFYNLIEDTLFTKRITAKDVDHIIQNKSLINTRPATIQQISRAAVPSYPQNFGMNHKKVLFSPDGKILACQSSLNNDITLWDIDNIANQVNVDTNKDISTSEKTRVYLNKKSYNNNIQTLKEVAEGMAFSHKDNYFAHRSLKNLSREPLHPVQIGLISRGSSSPKLYYSSLDDKYFGPHDDSYVFFTFGPNNYIFLYQKHIDIIYAYEFTKDSTRFYPTLYGQVEDLKNALLLVPDDQTLFVLNRSDLNPDIKMYKIFNNKINIPKDIMFLKKFSGPELQSPTSMAVNWPNKLLAMSAFNEKESTIRVWNIDNDICVWSRMRDINDSKVFDIQFSPDGTMLGLAGSNKEASDFNNIIELIDTKNWRTLLNIKQKTNDEPKASSLSFGPKGETIAIGGDGIQTKIWIIKPKLTIDQAVVALLYKQNNGKIPVKYKNIYDHFPQETKDILPLPTWTNIKNSIQASAPSLKKQYFDKQEDTVNANKASLFGAKSLSLLRGNFPKNKPETPPSGTKRLPDHN